MCGIIGILDIQNNFVAQNILRALSLLEYRGYDSIGITTIYHKQFFTRKTTNQVAHLIAQESFNPMPGYIGIGHTRWATHGLANELNCHPIIYENIAVVHNGIIENHHALKDKMKKEGYNFKTSTDTEIIAVLMHYYKAKGLTCKQAVNTLVQQLKGAFSFVILQQNKPYKLIGVRKESPLFLAHNNSTVFITSDANSIAEFTEEGQDLPNHSIVHINWRHNQTISPDDSEINDTINKKYPKAHLEIEFYDFDSNYLWPKIREIKKGRLQDRGEYETFMLKEIFEQPYLLQRIFNRLSSDLLSILPDSKQFTSLLENCNALHIVACGSSFYAGMTAKYSLEQLGNKPVYIELASEFCYKPPSLLDNKDIYILISQSGETADLIQALQKIKQSGGKTIGIINTPSSFIAQNVDFLIPMNIDPEIAVAATKSFTAPILILLLLALQMSKQDPSAQSQNLPNRENSRFELENNITNIHLILTQANYIENVASSIKEAPYILFIGRERCYPIALEGALKMKELAYIASEGYAAGELKHGSIALIERDIPVITLLPNDNYLQKNLSTIEEIKTRGGRVIAITTTLIAEREDIRKICDELIIVDPSHQDTSTKDLKISSATGLGDSIFYAIALQLLAYYTAKALNNNIDKPRNLAKSVTVE